MRDYGKVYSRFWQNRDVKRWSDGAKLAAVYLLTSPHANLVGIYYLPADYAAVDMGMEVGDVVKAFGELATHDFIAYDRESQWVWVRQFVAWNAFESPKVSISAARTLATLPNALPWYREALERVKRDGRWFSTDCAAQIDAMLEAHDAGKRVLLDDVSDVGDDENGGDEAMSLLAAVDDAPDDVTAAIIAWNGFAAKHDLAKVEHVTAERKSKLRQRLKECGGLEGWRKALERASASSFLLGMNDRGFFIDFDFMLQKSKFTKLMEGSYDDRTPPKGTASGRRDDLMDIADFMAGEVNPEEVI